MERGTERIVDVWTDGWICGNLRVCVFLLHFVRGRQVAFSCAYFPFPRHTAVVCHLVAIFSVCKVVLPRFNMLLVESLTTRMQSVPYLG